MRPRWAAQDPVVRMKERRVHWVFDCMTEGLGLEGCRTRHSRSAGAITSPHFPK